MMRSAIWLALMLATGLVLMLLAAAAGLRSAARQRRRRRIDRFSGAGQADRIRDRAKGTRQTALRRRERRRWPDHLLPGLSARSLALIGRRRRRIATLLAMGLALTTTLGLQRLLALNPIFALSLGAASAFLLWLVWARTLDRKRRAAIEETMPEALDMIVRGLRIGQPVATAIQVVASGVTGPLAREFSETADRISYGKEVTEALREAAERCQNQDMRFLAAAVAIQYATGGNLADVLERLCGIARGRQQMRRKVRAITAEAKWTGRFLSAFPLLACMALLAINPEYFSEISDKSFFQPMLAVVGLLLALNLLFMRRIARFE